MRTRSRRALSLTHSFLALQRNFAVAFRRRVLRARAQFFYVLPLCSSPLVKDRSVRVADRFSLLVALTALNIFLIQLKQYAGVIIDS